jgi:hypothetical protein
VCSYLFRDECSWPLRVYASTSQIGFETDRFGNTGDDIK